MKKMKRLQALLLSTILIFSLVLSACGGATSDSSVDSVNSSVENNMNNSNFVLCDEKIIFDEATFLKIGPSATVFLHRLIIILKKATIYEKLTIEDFNIDNITDIDYQVFEPEEDKLDDSQYMENFRQELSVDLTDVKNTQELLAVIREIEKLDFVKEVRIISIDYDI